MMVINCGESNIYDNIKIYKKEGKRSKKTHYVILVSDTPKRCFYIEFDNPSNKVTAKTSFPNTPGSFLLWMTDEYLIDIDSIDAINALMLLIELDWQS